VYGSYGVAHGIVSSFPLRSKGDGGYDIAQGVYELPRLYRAATLKCDNSGRLLPR